jgi:hypothetical protein
MLESATKCNETIGKWCKKQAWSIKNYRYVGDVSSALMISNVTPLQGDYKG